MKLLRELFRKKLNTLPVDDAQPGWDALRNRLDAEQGRKGFLSGKSTLLLSTAVIVVSAFVLFLMNEDSFFSHPTSNKTLATVNNEVSNEPSYASLNETHITHSNRDVYKKETTVADKNGKGFSDYKVSSDGKKSSVTIKNKAADSPSTLLHINSSRDKESDLSESNYKLQSSVASRSSATSLTRKGQLSGQTAIANPLETEHNQVSVSNDSEINRHAELFAGEQMLRPESAALLALVQANPWQLIGSNQAAFMLAPVLTHTDPIYFKKKFNFYVGAEAGMQWNVQHSYSVYDNEHVSRYMNGERNRASLTGGLSFLANYKGFTLSTGLNYFSNAYSANYENNFNRFILQDSTSYINTHVLTTTFDTTWVSFPEYQQGWNTTDTILTFYNPSTGTYSQGNLPMVISNGTNSDTTLYAIVDTNFVVIADSIVAVYQVQKLERYALTDPSKLKSVQYFSYVEVPLLMGYTLTKGKWGIQLSGGASISFYHRHEAIYLKNDLSAIRPVHTSMIRKTGYHLLAQAGVTRRLHGPWEISFALRNRFDITSVYQDAWISRRFNSTGLLVGLRYKF